MYEFLLGKPLIKFYKPYFLVRRAVLSFSHVVMRPSRFSIAFFFFIAFLFNFLLPNPD